MYGFGKRLAYHDKFQDFKDLNDFVVWGLAGKKMYAKNFIRRPATGQQLSWKGNNCAYNRTKKYIRCRYGDPSTWFEPSSPFVKDLILFNNGLSANSMSYITAAQKPDKSRYIKHFTTEQMQIIRFGLHGPFYGLLRNHALTKIK